MEWLRNQGEPRYTDGTTMIVDKPRCENISRLRQALEDIVELTDDQVYVRARGIALRALIANE